MAANLKPATSDELMSPQGQWGGREGRDILDYVRILYRRRRVFLLGLGATVALAILYIIFTPRVWGVTAKVLIGSAANNPIIPSSISDLTSAVSSSPFFGAGTEVKTQIEVFRSRSVLAAAYDLTKSKPELVRAFTDGRKRRPDSEDMKQLLASLGGAQLPEPARMDPELLLLVTSLDISQSAEGTNVVSVSAASHDPKLAGDFVNAVCLAYLASSLERVQRVASNCLDYVNGELQATEAKLRAAEKALVAFTAQTSHMDPQTVLQGQMQAVLDQRKQLRDLYAQLAQKQVAVGTAQRLLRQQNEEIVQSRTETINPVVSSLESKLADLNLQRAELLQRYTPESRRVREIDEQIAATRKELKSQLTNVAASTTRAINPLAAQLASDVATTQVEISSLKAAIAKLERSLAEDEKQAAKAPSRQLEFANLSTEVDVLRDRYKLLRAKQDEYRLAKESQITGSDLLEPALVQDRYKVRPKLIVTLFLACVMGSFVGLLLAFAVEALEDHYLDLNEAEQDLHLATLGVIPQERIAGPAVLTDPQATDLFREAFLSLHANLGFAAGGNPPGVVVVAAATDGEGTTTVATNLALAAALAGERVALVDADLRQPGVTDLLAFSPKAGLAEVLSGQARADEALTSVGVGTNGELLVLAAGQCPGIPQALLESPAMDDTLKRLRGRADLVIVDAGAVGDTSDALIVAGKSDAVLLVLSLEGARRAQVQGARAQLQRAGAQLLGLVVNGAPVPRGRWRLLG
jgi:capsular exopolysaccharide synthesis family protein